MNLPTGTVTLCFAEVDRGSASLHGMPDAHLPAASLRPALQFALQTHNATVLSLEDTGLRASFANPAEALSAAVAIQQIFHPERGVIPAEVRSGVRRFCVALHTGPVQVEEGHYVGETVERTVHLLEAGHSGQIVVSAECAQALQRRLPADVQLRNLGKFQFGGQTEGTSVFQVMHADLPADFPPLRLASAAATNLPIPFTAFIGRDAEIAELRRTLAGVRLLTLIGSAGIGKSRLAIRLASELRSAFPDGVWFAELPALADMDLVTGVAAWALHVQTAPDAQLLDALIIGLRDKKALLALEVDELNRAQTARFVTALSGACPNVKFIVCARRGLGVRDEAIYCVPALASSDIEGGGDAERLCYDRAALLPNPPDLNGALLTELCFLLNGIPLALELAIGGLAAHPEETLFGLVQAMYDLINGQQLSWEQTLQLVLDWSYQRLSETEQRLLERLSVFQSGWSLEAATAICCDEVLTAELLPNLLESLRAAGFVVAEERAGFNRERLCEAVRHYAEGRLTRRGAAAEYMHRHAEYFLSLAEQGALGLTGPDQEGWRVYLEREYLNFRAALVCLRQDTELADQELRLATALLPLFTCSGRPADGRSLVAHATESKRLANTRPEEYPTTRANFLTAIERCRANGDQPREIKNLTSLARLARAQNDFATARSANEQLLTLFRGHGDRTQEARTLHSLGSAARDGGEYTIARDSYEQALELNRSLGCRIDEAHNLNGLARLALLQGDSAEATRRFQEGLILFRELGEHAWEAHNMGQILRLSLPSEPLWERSPAYEGAEH